MDEIVGIGPRDPEALEAAATGERGEIAARTTVGPVHLTVSELDRSLSYYEQAIGLRILERGPGRARLGAGARELVVLTEQAGARPATGYCGLYHFALLLPERVQLAGFLAHAARERMPLVGMSDHFVSEAIYLRDPDEHGIEIYWDRPREHWEGQVAARMTTLPLDVHGLLAELDDPRGTAFDRLPAGTVMGHVHLRVAEIPATVNFYRDCLGFALMAQLGRQAGFFAAGGYHHHLGANTWESAGAPPAPPETAGLRQATIMLPDVTERARVIDRLAQRDWEIDEASADPVVRDPSGTALALTVAPAG